MVTTLNSEKNSSNKTHQLSLDSTGQRQILFVASGKGGVGKSTVSVGLAYAMKELGLKVGLYDADIYGPSLPHFFPLTKNLEQDSEGKIIPVESEGLKIMSVGYISSPDKAQILRGPMASNMIKQLYERTNWSDCDVVLIDCPPGTGDILLTMAQSIQATGAVLVTSNSDLAYSDVIKAHDMFCTVKIPVLGFVGSMNVFVCHDCEKSHELFPGHSAKKMKEVLGVPFLGEVSFVPHLSSQFFQSILKKEFMKIAEKVSQALGISFDHSRKSLGSFSLRWRKE